MDEKGFLMIGAFGLPGKTHEDDAVRGLRAALYIIQSLKVAHAFLSGLERFFTSSTSIFFT